MKRSLAEIVGKIIPAILLLFVLLPCAVSAPNSAPPKPVTQRSQEVSLIQLIANPEKYDGKLINVTGFVHVEFEGDAVYLSEEDYKHGITKNGIGIGVADKNSGILLSKEKYGDRYCYIKGIFHAIPPRYYFPWSGSISLKEISPSD